MDREPIWHITEKDKLQRFLDLRDFDEYMEQFGSFQGLEMGKETFRKEMLLMESDEKYSHRQKDAIRQKKKREIIKNLRQEISSIQEEVKCHGVWQDSGEQEKVLPFIYRYPNGKEGDISHYAAMLLGNCRELAEGVYEAAIPSSRHDLLEIAAFPARSLFSHYNYSEPDEIAVFLVENNRIARLEYTMWKLNYYTREIRNIRSVPDPGLRRLISDYHQKIAAGRDEIYEALIVGGETNARWVSEQKAFAIVKAHFPDAKFQYKPDWLQGQSLDIFLPGLNTAIEYQGLQHTEPVEIFGGNEGLKNRMNRDKKKWVRCRQKDVNLLYWDSEKPLTEKYFLEEIFPHIIRGNGEDTCFDQSNL